VFKKTFTHGYTHGKYSTRKPFVWDDWLARHITSIWIIYLITTQRLPHCNCYGYLRLNRWLIVDLTCFPISSFLDVGNEVLDKLHDLIYQINIKLISDFRRNCQKTKQNKKLSLACSVSLVDYVVSRVTRELSCNIRVFTWQWCTKNRNVFLCCFSCTNDNVVKMIKRL